MKKSVKIITRTAIFLALLLVLQYVTKLSGIQLLTGSVVNLMLIVGVYYCEIYGGLVLAIISPILAFFLGITPLASFIIVPMIALGNSVYVIIAHLVFKKVAKKQVLFYPIGVVSGAAAKFGILSVLVKFVAIPYILELKDASGAAAEKITATLTAAFTFTQLYTALIGGAVALVLIKLLNKTLKK